MDFFKKNKVILNKLDHSMSDSYTGMSQYDAYMQLSHDGEFIKIVKKVPLRNMFIQSANDNLILKEKAKLK